MKGERYCLYDVGTGVGRHTNQAAGKPFWRQLTQARKLRSYVGSGFPTNSFEGQRAVLECGGFVSVHVFIDNSNVFFGSHRAAEVREKHIPPYAIRVYYRHLFMLVEGERQVATRIMAGSVPPGNEELWGYAREGGYGTDLLRRVEVDDGSWREQGVDELLHLKIANVLLDYEAPQTLVLVTGDGRTSAFGTSFPLQAERALKRSWSVEVWSWRQALSPVFAELSLRYTGLSMHELDRHYKAITFIRAGRYRREDGKLINVAERRVSSVPT